MARETDTERSHEQVINSTGDVAFAEKARGAVKTCPGGPGQAWGGQGRFPVGRVCELTSEG